MRCSRNSTAATRVPAYAAKRSGVQPWSSFGRIESGHTHSATRNRRTSFGMPWLSAAKRSGMHPSSLVWLTRFRPQLEQELRVGDPRLEGLNCLPRHQSLGAPAGAPPRPGTKSLSGPGAGGSGTQGAPEACLPFPARLAGTPRRRPGPKHRAPSPIHRLFVHVRCAPAHKKTDVSVLRSDAWHVDDGGVDREGDSLVGRAPEQLGVARGDDDISDRPPTGATLCCHSPSPRGSGPLDLS